MASWAYKGLDYGIDFKGGTAGLCPLRGYAAQLIVTALGPGARRRLGRSVIQPISDISSPNSNEVVIYLPQEGEGNQALDTGKAEIDKALHATLGSAEAGKQDFNAATESALADVLVRRDPLGLGVNAGDRYTQLARQLIAYRDRKLSGEVQNLDQLQGAQAAAPVLAAIRQDFYASPFAVVNVDIVGPKVGADLRRQAVLVTLYALGGMLIYIAFRFEWVYGAAAVLAVFHDVLITLGLFSLLGFEVSLTVIAALLTLVGYSMNDTIVIFDRIRENRRLMRRGSPLSPYRPIAPSIRRAVAYHPYQRAYLPNRPGTVFNGWSGVAQFFICLGGRNFDRNIFKLRHCRPAGGRLGSLEGHELRLDRFPVRWPARRLGRARPPIASRLPAGGSSFMFDELVESECGRKENQQALGDFHLHRRSVGDRVRPDFDPADLYGSAAQGHDGDTARRSSSAATATAASSGGEGRGHQAGGPPDYRGQN